MRHGRCIARAGLNRISTDVNRAGRDVGNFRQVGAGSGITRNRALARRYLVPEDVGDEKGAIRIGCIGRQLRRSACTDIYGGGAGRNGRSLINIHRDGGCIRTGVRAG